MRQEQTTSAGESIWHSVPATKISRPRPRPDTVIRGALLDRMQTAAMQNRVCFVGASAGYGKTTLLIQLAERCEAEGVAQCVWLSLGESENDVNRLLVLLLCALRGLALKWPTAPHLLASQVQLGGPQAHAAVGIIVNALESFRGERLLIFLDDLHCVTDEAALDLLTALIELLPPEISVVIGSRTATILPLPRWLVRRELVELRSEDLRFSEADALAMVRLGASPSRDEASVRSALRLTEGWVAGLQLMLHSGLALGVDADATRNGERALFDYFAQESFSRLSAEAQDFLLQCSILTELSPPVCRTVTGRADAQAVLTALYRQNLFLTALDEVEPVLRFHELFAAFLRHKLSERGQETVRALHARAATVEEPMRAVAHWLAAQNWTAATRQMSQLAPSLLAEGGVAMLLRWLAALPGDFADQDVEVQFLQALAAIHQWDFARAIAPLERAMHGFRAQQRDAEHHFCAVLLPRACNAAGALGKAAEILDYADTLPLDAAQRIALDTAHVWQCAALAPQACAPLLESVAWRAEAEPGLLPMCLDNLSAPHFCGMPRVIPAFQRLREQCRRQLNHGEENWQLRAMAASAWPELWYGERTRAELAMAHARAQLNAIDLLPVARFNMMAQEVFFHLALDEPATATLWQHEISEAMLALNPGFAATWYRVNLFTLARTYWAAQDRASLEALWPQLDCARTPVEFPAVDTCRAQLGGQLAWLRGDLSTAERLLGEAARMQMEWCLPNFCGDARTSLALVLQERGDERAAQQCFASLLEEMLTDDSPALLLLEPRIHRERLQALLPAEASTRTEVRALWARMATWRATPVTSHAGPADAAMAALSERECEVLALLARGDSNQAIADQLHISLNTVKRHVANIMAKLDCGTRGQAAARWHAYTG